MDPEDTLTHEEALIVAALRSDCTLQFAILAWLDGDRAPLLSFCAVPMFLAEDDQRLTEIAPAIGSE